MRLSVDFSAEILHIRREWHNILKVMKGKKLKQRICYPAHSDLTEKKQKLYRQAKAKGIQHHQTSFTTNAKRVSLG